MFEQRSSLGGRFPTRTVFSSGAQKPVRRRCAHREQLASALLREVQMPMLLECFDKSGQKRDQPFGTDLIGCFPCEEKCLLDLWSIVNGTRMRDTRRRFDGMIEKPHGIFADVAGHGDERIEQEHLLRARRLKILRSHQFDELASGLITQG